MKICVFCQQEKDDDCHVCLGCKEYKGIEEAWRCSCGAANAVFEKKCLDCGRKRRCSRRSRKS